jgi:hypothetical protein
VKLGAKLASLKLESFLELHIKNFPVLKLAEHRVEILKNLKFFLIQKLGIWIRQLQFQEEIINCLQDFCEKTNFIRKSFILIELSKHTRIRDRKVL